MLEQAKARELLADAFDAEGYAVAAKALRDNEELLFTVSDKVSLKAITAALEAGRAEERERVVAWLRGEVDRAVSTGRAAYMLVEAAEALERGEHEPNERPNGR